MNKKEIAISFLLVCLFGMALIWYNADSQKVDTDYKVCQWNKCEVWDEMTVLGGWGTKCVYGGEGTTEMCGNFTVEYIRTRK